MDLLCKTTHKKLPKWKVIYNDLEHKINNYNIGERFYTLAEIGKEYNVSKITALTVLSELENKGFVEKIPKRGTIVRSSQEVFYVKLILPTYLVSISQNIVSIRIHRGIIKEAEKLKLDFSVISEDYINQLSLNDNGKLGFLIFENTGGKTLEFLKNSNVPFIFLHNPTKIEGVVSVINDIMRGGYLATEHLISLGHKRIGIICGKVSYDYQLQRFKGYLKALRKGKIKFDWSLLKETSGSEPKEDEQAIKELLSLSSPPTAIFTGNDYRALHIMKFCQKNGIRIPDDLSIVGYDNISESMITQPPLTTVDTHLEKIGSEGLKCLIKMIVEKRKILCKDIIVKTELVIRESTKAINVY